MAKQPPIHDAAMLKLNADLPLVHNLRKLFLSDTPMLDVRAPLEYQQGAFPGSVNVPLMTNDERHEIGLRYKQAGNDEAIRLGLKLVDATVREPRIAAWQAFFESHPQGVLYCFRGGLRSKIAQQWLYDSTGRHYPRIEGGYKAMRRFLLDEGVRLSNAMQITLLGGRTGSGKTRLLHQLSASLDLEGLANHRGSAFGPRATAQPSQIDFENALFIQMLKAEQQHSHLLLEDEGRNIGSVHLPHELHGAMSASALALLEVTDEERIDISLQEYVIDMLRDHQQVAGEEQGFENYQSALTGSLAKIQKRLGGARYQQLSGLMEHALQQEQKGLGTDAHRAWISELLFGYYDPMYDYQLSKKHHRIVFRGTRDEMQEWWQSRQA